MIMGFIKGRAQGKLTACEHEFARLFLNLGFQHHCTCKEHVHPYAWVLSPDTHLLQILMNPLVMILGDAVLLTM